MMIFTDETLSAFIDGELSDAETGRITEALAHDRELAARLNLLRTGDTWIRDQFGATDDLPVRAETNELIDQLASQLALASGQDTVITLPAPKKNTRSWIPSAVAASIALAVGFGVGTHVPSEDQSRSAEASLSTKIGPGHPYFTALETTPSMATSPVTAGEARTLTPLASFRNNQGRYCREFGLKSQSHESFNLACKDDDSWTVVASVAAGSPPAEAVDGYIPASDKGASLLDDLIREQMEGDILSAEDEATLIKHAWQ